MGITFKLIYLKIEFLINIFIDLNFRNSLFDFKINYQIKVQLFVKVFKNISMDYE